MGGEQSSYCLSSCVEHIRMGRRVTDTEVANFDFRDVVVGDNELFKTKESRGEEKEMQIKQRDLDILEAKSRGCER